PVRAAHHVHPAGARPPRRRPIRARPRTGAAGRPGGRRLPRTRDRIMTHPAPTTLARNAGALLAALALAGCAAGPQYQAPTPAPVKLASPEQALFSADQLQRDWWRQLQDARLDSLIGLAL